MRRQRSGPGRRTAPWRSGSGRPGAMRRVKKVTGDVLTLDSGLPNANFPTDDKTVAALATRLRRWEGYAKVADPPADVPLEDGVSIQLSLVQGGTEYRTGDYWVFYARNASA